MRIKHDEIVAFIAVAETKSFSRAAKDLGITQPALSQRLRKLEDGLGTKLLDRSTRSVSLTKVGEVFFPVASRANAAFQRSLIEIRDIIALNSGHVAVACNTSLVDTLLPDVIEQFAAAHPRIHVKVLDMSGPSVMRSVAQGEVDLGIAQMADVPPELMFEPLLRDQLHLICRKDHPLARRKIVEWKELANYKMIEMAPSMASHKIVAQQFAAYGGGSSGKYEVAHSAALLALVAKNLGVAAMPKFVLRKRPDLDLVARPLASPKYERVSGIVTLSTRTLSPAASALAGLLRVALVAASAK